MQVRLLLPVLLCVVAASGCRSKSWESFESSTTPNKAGTWQGDEYASGGIAGSSGGLQAKTRYGEGARDAQPGKLMGTLDQPAKGTGLRPGEFNGAGVPGSNRSNAPVNQGEPGSVNSPTVQSGRE